MNAYLAEEVDIGFASLYKILQERHMVVFNGDQYCRTASLSNSVNIDLGLLYKILHSLSLIVPSRQSQRCTSLQEQKSYQREKTFKNEKRVRLTAVAT
jgi:hypothetical protein